MSCSVWRDRDGWVLHNICYWVEDYFWKEISPVEGKEVRSKNKSHFDDEEGKENKEQSRSTQWFSGDNDSLFTHDQCNIPEEVDEVSRPSHAATGDIA